MDYLGKILGSLGFQDGFYWDANGNIYGRENLTPEQNAALDAAIAAYDPEVEGRLKAKQVVLDELAALDALLPRAVEDIVAAANLYDSLPQIMKTRIDRKTALRTQLKEMV